MIGQNNIRKLIDTQIANNDFPRFSIIVGDKGSGKKELVNYIHSSFEDSILYSAETKVEDVRKVVSDAYKISGTPVIYTFLDADRMSVSAKNALLKVAEEPPHNAYIIMTLTNLENTLETLKSRASVYHMEPYSKHELMEYCMLKEYTDVKILEVCNNPGEIDQLMTICSGDVDCFFAYITLILDNLAEVTLGNSLKSVSKVALKETDTDKYDLKMFWNGVISIIMKRINREGKIDVDELRQWGNIVTFTKECISTLNKVPSINKSALLDLWIIKFRQEILEGEH